jgi:hypothetical protein
VTKSNRLDSLRGPLGAGSPGPRAAEIFERPDLDGTLLAKGMGVPGTRVFVGCIREGATEGLASEGPPLIELLLLSRAARRR